MAKVPTPSTLLGEPLYPVAIFAIGFLLEFNLVPAAWHVPVQRISLFTTFPLIALMIHRQLGRPNPLSTITYSAVIILFVILHIAAGGISLRFGSMNFDLTLSLQNALYLIGGIGLYILIAQRSGTAAFCWGLLVGAVLSLVVFVMEANGMNGLAKAVGLTQTVQTVQMAATGGSSSRLTGMWGHANEAGHVLAIAAPAAGYLYVSRRQIVPLLLLALVTFTCFYFTGNRGGVIATLLTAVLIVFVRSETPVARRNGLLLAVGALMIVAWALYFLPAPDFIYARFVDDNHLDNNASGRMATTLNGLSIAARNPFGLGDETWRNLLRQTTGFQTPHNGFITMMNSMGLPFALLFVAALVVVVIAGLRRPRKLSLDIFLMLAAVQATVSFMFEELSNVDPFLIIQALIMARVYSGAVALQGRRNSAPRRRQSSRGVGSSPAALETADRNA